MQQKYNQSVIRDSSGQRIGSDSIHIQLQSSELNNEWVK